MTKKGMNSDISNSLLHKEIDCLLRLYQPGNESETDTFPSESLNWWNGCWFSFLYATMFPCPGNHVL